MSKTPTQLANLSGRDFVETMKLALRDDVAWEVFSDPLVIERTRWALNTVMASIAVQIANDATPNPRWLNQANSLRRLCRSRLGSLPVNDGPVVSGAREARAWRAFAGAVAERLAEADPEALEGLHAPYGGMNGMDWLIARNRKKAGVVR